MRIFGITGGSGSGKTTVSKMLSDMGVYIIDTDEISREVTEKGSDCLRELQNAFGGEIIAADGTLDRRKLASIAFADKEKTALLGEITHKYIKSETLRRIQNTDAALIGIDGAVIIGSPIEKICEKIVAVTADTDVRLQRIIRRDTISGDEAKKRLGAQQNEEFYRKNSDYIVDNSGSRHDLKNSVSLLYNKLKEV